MKAVLVDSDVLIEVSRRRNHSLIMQWREIIRDDVLVLCSPVTVAELWHGVLPREELALNDLLAALTCIPIDAETGQRARDYLRQYAKSHHVELGDALIAAAASIHKVPLWTRNLRCYPVKDVAFF